MANQMTDMLVNLEELKVSIRQSKQLEEEGFIIRRPLVIELDILFEWTLKHFGMGWANEVKKCFFNTPISCWIAQIDNEVAGFACYESTAKGFFGPTGVSEKFRRKGIGEVLLTRSLDSLKHLGYVYSIIGGVSAVEYYSKKVNAIVIEGSSESIYKHRLRRDGA